MFLSAPPACLACFVVYRCVYTCSTHIYIYFLPVLIFTGHCFSMCICEFNLCISLSASTACFVLYRCVCTCVTHICLARSHLHGSYVLFFNVYMLVQLVYLFVSTKSMFCCVSIIDCVSMSVSISSHRQSSWHSSPSPSHDVATGVGFGV